MRNVGFGRKAGQPRLLAPAREPGDQEPEDQELGTREPGDQELGAQEPENQEPKEQETGTGQGLRRTAAGTSARRERDAVSGAQEEALRGTVTGRKIMGWFRYAARRSTSTP